MNGQGGEIYFAGNYHDLCQQSGTGAGFQFEFNCSRCHDTWRSAFQPYTSGRMAGWVDRAVSSAWGAFGRAGSEASSALDGLVGANWGPSKDAAFRKAITDAQAHFNRCARCTSYVCDRCWNAGQGLCLNCAPDTAAEVAAARQRGLNDVASQRAYDVGGSSGAEYDVNRSTQLVCPHCHTETHGANFCPGCGYRLAQSDSCGSCRADVPQGAAFCPSCGTRR
ncbi:double zinc ribbon domain-containing protein [Streptacidiphilus rugosus]|uniref:double zinc ribbon domain-containing protein n=1 Tax=Streptacidiphilus rugosus TaxID=405783 RepID=UPI0005617033|nr:zinc ribbon domain-containing protein [Streptacidiphilus rugosus]